MTIQPSLSAQARSPINRTPSSPQVRREAGVPSSAAAPGGSESLQSSFVEMPSGDHAQTRANLTGDIRWVRDDGVGKRVFTLARTFGESGVRKRDDDLNCSIGVSLHSPLNE